MTMAPPLPSRHHAFLETDPRPLLASFLPLCRQARVADVAEIHTIAHLQPEACFIANAFGTRSIGHFLRSRMDEEDVDGDGTSRRVHATLRRHGSAKIATTLCNQRPACWRRRFARAP